MVGAIDGEEKVCLKTLLFQTQRENSADESATREQEKWASVFDCRKKNKMERKIRVFGKSNNVYNAYAGGGMHERGR